MKVKICLATAALVATTLASSAQASTFMLGELYFTGNSLNYYISANGFVPVDFNNEFNNLVPVDDGVEFGFEDGHNLDAADFTSKTLTLYDLVFDGVDDPGSIGWTQKFTASTPGFFDGITLVNSDFAGLTYSVTGDTLTVNWGGASGSGYYQADFAFNGVPEPATWAMMIAGFGMAGVALRRRRRLSLAA